MTGTHPSLGGMYICGWCGVSREIRGKGVGNEGVLHFFMIIVNYFSRKPLTCCAAVLTHAVAHASPAHPGTRKAVV